MVPFYNLSALSGIMCTHCDVVQNFKLAIKISFFGRTGLNGSIAWAHLFHMRRKQPEKDDGLAKLFSSTETADGNVC